ncbi:hypothetical protein GWI33_006341 [Rhynchophorus ferrugineus]|uniref:Uncharacterized protein n=1 Tax=Rhynchophorus ferrugineus TaxID=354439 RepID=A0A834IM33_RHYFE|nr:hypothetical protein GWI33_006341 [Rhynchophorus ferrugineus]
MRLVEDRHRTGSVGGARPPFSARLRPPRSFSLHRRSSDAPGARRTDNIRNDTAIGYIRKQTELVPYH